MRSSHSAGLTCDPSQFHLPRLIYSLCLELQKLDSGARIVTRPAHERRSPVTDLQSHADDVEGVFNLWMLSPVGQLLAQPDPQTTQGHTPDRRKIKTQ